MKINIKKTKAILMQKHAPWCKGPIHIFISQGMSTNYALCIGLQAFSSKLSRQLFRRLGHCHSSQPHTEAKRNYDTTIKKKSGSSIKSWDFLFKRAPSQGVARFYNGSGMIGRDVESGNVWYKKWSFEITQHLLAGLPKRSSGARSQGPRPTECSGVVSQTGSC